MRGNTPLVGVLVVGALAAAPRLGAVTDPIGGAVPKPAGLDLSWPFAAGEAVTLLSGYSPSGGSSLHDGTNRTGATNDYFALDLTLEEHANHGKGQDVLAAAGGVVVKAGWATEGWANYGQRVILEHDIGDGHTYVTLYAHLDRIDVVEGDSVAKGQTIGALGSSCQGQLTCGSFGTPHLHFALHRDSAIGGSGTGGSYGGVAVVPEIIDGAEDLTPGEVHASQNGGGDPPPPPEPPAECVLGDAAGAELVVEEDGVCARMLGPAEYWHPEDGSGGASHWTYAIQADAPDNRVRWTVEVGIAGDVEVFAIVPPYATSAAARYVVENGGAEAEVVVDQASQAGTTTSLGTFTCVPGPLEVRLADNTGEPYTGEQTSKKLAFDAIVAWRPTSDEPPPDEPPPDEPPPDEPPPDEPPPDEPPPDEPPGDDDAGDPPPDGEPSVDGGGCAASPTGLAALWALLALARSRRRR